ncbi:MAG: hypothetical protein U0168_02220 [Nannocystaceae bacterium]
MSAVALFAMLLAVAPATASDTVVAAERAWSEGRFAEAAEGFARAYAETGDIAYLFARGQAQKAAGDCVAAITTLEAFIATEPLPQAVTAAEATIDACRAELPEPAPEPEPAPAPVPPPRVEPAAPSDRAPARRWQRDPAAASLVAVGSAIAITGAVLAIVARREQSLADRAGVVDDFGTHNDRAVALSRASIPVLVSGGALLVGGIVRYAVLARRDRHARRARP